MAQIWEAEFKIDIETVRSILKEQFPELGEVRISLLGEGRNNIAFLVNKSYVFRFPRRQVAVELIVSESRFLPKLATRLPLQITSPCFIGKSTAIFEYPFAGYPYIEGKPAYQFNKKADCIDVNATVLANFLKTLHSIAVDSETRSQAPGDKIGRTNLKRRAVKIEERLRRHRSQLPQIDIDGLITLVSNLSKTPPNQSPIFWVHGDLYPTHLLMDESGFLCGVIDWGSLHLGDPALDLSIAFTFLPVSAHKDFRQRYGEITSDCWNRARFTSIYNGAALLDYGIDTKDIDFIEMGKQALTSGFDGSE